MKKYIIALGSLGTIVTPLVSVISCNKPKDTGKVVVKQIDLATDKVLSYLQGKKPALLEALKTAREESDNTKELKENLVANISSGNISTGMMLGFDEKLTKFATLEVVKGIVEKNLKLIAPTGSLKRKGTYGISWVKDDKVIIKNQELGYVIANKGFFNKLDTAMKLKGKITLAIDSFSKMKDEDKIIPKLIGLDLLKGKIGVALNSLKDLDFTVKDFKDIISSVKMIVHNIDADLPAIMASNHKMKSLMKLLKTPNVILDKKEFYNGVTTLIHTFADLMLRNKKNIPIIIDVINRFSQKPIINDLFKGVVISVINSNSSTKFFDNLKHIEIEQMKSLMNNISKISRNNDLSHFDILKFIANKKNKEPIINILNTLFNGLKAKGVVIDVLTNMLNSNNFNGLKNKKPNSISNILKLLLTNSEGIFEYDKVKGFVAKIIENTNISIDNVQQIVTYFTSDKFSVSLKSATSLKGKIKLFINIFKQKEILSAIKNPTKFKESINEFGYFITMNLLDKLQDQKQIEENSKVLTTLGLFASNKNAKVMLEALQPVIKESKNMLLNGTTLGDIFIMIWSHRQEIVEALDKTWKTGEKDKHITYAEALKFLTNTFTMWIEVKSTGWFSTKNVPHTYSKDKQPHNINDFIEVFLNWKGQAFWVNGVDGSSGVEIQKKVIALGKNKKIKMNSLDVIINTFAKLYDAPFISDLKIFSYNFLVRQLLTKEGFITSYVPDKVKAQLKKFMKNLGLIPNTSDEAIAAIDRTAFNIKIQKEIKQFLTNLFAIKLGGNQKLINFKTLKEFTDTALFNAIIKMMGF